MIKNYAPPCEKRISSHCLRRTITEIIENEGVFTDEMRLTTGTLHEIPSSIDPLIATLTEPLAAALQRFEMSSAQKKNPRGTWTKKARNFNRLRRIIKGRIGLIA